MLKFFDTQGVCESVLYGTPHILKPTTCWKLDWEELERNHHHFNALCQLLQSRVRKDQRDLFSNLCSLFIGKGYSPLFKSLTETGNMHI